MTDAIAMLISFCSGAGAFAAGAFFAVILLNKPELKPVQHVIHKDPPTTPPVSLARPKKQEKLGAVTRPTAETLDKKEHPRQAEEEAEMEKAFDALVNSPHNNTMQMSK